MELTRRHFFRFSAQETLEAVGRAVGEVFDRLPAAPAEPEYPPFLRPPGALAEPEFLSKCTGCDECIKACPKWAIRKAGSELGAKIDGTPIILPDDAPCWLCKDLPCIASCEPGALVPLASRDEVRMGRIAIDAEHCYAAQGSICETCQDRCPLRPRAIAVSFGQLPRVDIDRCTGCGVCAYLCPADAITVVAGNS